MSRMTNIVSAILFGLITIACSAQPIVQLRLYFDYPSNGYQFITVPNIQSIDAPFEVDVSTLSQGVHRLYIQVQDADGVWSLYDAKIVQIVGGLNMATLNMMEYFFNADPGFGEGIQIAVSGNSVNESFNISLEGVSNGIHQLYIRVRDGANHWSLYEKKIIHVVGSMMQELIYAEYYYDTEPGLGNAQPIDLTAFTGDGDFELSTLNLSTGVHTLYIRVLDAGGIWSLYDKVNLIITNPITPSTLVIAEYYFDTDPGEGNAIPLIIPQQQYVDGDFEIDLPDELTGTHTICIRVLNGSGIWSDVSCEEINICNIIEPVILVTGENCQDTPYILSIPAGVYDSILWSTNESTNSIEVTEPGSYSVTVNDNGCSTITTQQVDFELMNEIVFNVSGSSCYGDVQMIQVTNAYDEYLWYDGSETSFVEVTENGSYQVQVTQGN